MSKKYFLWLLLLSVVICWSLTEANARKKSKSYIKLVEAYSQRIIPGIPGAQARTEYHFIVVWEGAKYPEAFFWRGDNSWLSCSIVKAHKMTSKAYSVQAIDYTIERVSNNDIHKGDTLELKPIPGGNLTPPEEIHADAENILYFKTGGSGWLSLPIKNIGKKQDRAMP